MGFFKDLWDGVKSVGSWIGDVFVDFAKGLWAALTGLAGTVLGWLIVGAYLTWLWARNLGKEPRLAHRGRLLNVALGTQSG